MSETEIALARAYLSASEQDPIAALIRSVKDLARLSRTLGRSFPYQEFEADRACEATLRTLHAIETSPAAAA